MGKAIAFATPMFFLLIAVELLLARARGLTGAYRLNDAINSLSLGVMKMINIAHGDLIVLGAYLCSTVMQALGVGPFLSLLAMLIIARSMRSTSTVTAPA